MALVSPGVELTIIDESQYLPAALATVPLIVIATAENKTINGVIAPGTTKANTGKIYGISSQRELASTFGIPRFRRSAADTPLHGDELNEYGLMAAYSALGLGNRAWVVRADVDLDDLIGTSVRPRGATPNGSNWLDFGLTKFGIYEFNNAIAIPDMPFEEKVPIIIDTNDTYGANLVISGTNPPEPVTSIGNKGDYAMVVGDDKKMLWKKARNNTWVELGSTDWANDIPTLTSTKTEAASGITSTPIAGGTTFKIAGSTITIANAASSFGDLATEVNTGLIDAGITNVITANVDNRFVFTATSGTLNIQDGPTYFLSEIGIFPTQPATPANVSLAGQTVTNAAFGITWTWNTISSVWVSDQLTFNRAALHVGGFATAPSWRKGSTTPRPNGSIWLKTSAQGGGANFAYKRYSSSTSKWNSISAPVYTDGAAAINGLDSGSGGLNISPGQVFVRAFGSDSASHAGYKIFTQRVRGRMVATGLVTSPVFNASHTFSIQASQPGSNSLVSSGVIAVGGTSATAFVASVLAANVPNVTAQVEPSGAISFIHKTGGIIVLNPGTGTALSAAGFINPTSTLPGTIGATLDLVTAIGGSSAVILSNWIAAPYAYSRLEPVPVPEDGTLWYYDDPTAVDIMINDLDNLGRPAWRGYKNVSSDARGYNLAMTDQNGVIVSASEPKYQTGSTPLVSGDLWLDTSDLSNYPSLYRYNAANTLWVKVDNADRISQNGILFADARWDATTVSATSVGGLLDPARGTMPNIQAMLDSDYTDLDCPDARLYPRGTLLFNTRRSGYTVKKFVMNYFNDVVYPSPAVLPVQRHAWVSNVSYDVNGHPYMGAGAQRNEIVEALKAQVDGNTYLREDVYNYNILCAPGYPELIENMVKLNNDRASTGFVIGDTPFTLKAASADFISYSNNVLTNNSPYLAVYYPSGLTNDLNGNEIAVPPSHMMLRTYMYNDQVSYQWFAPAGTRRGLIDNAKAIGYVDSQTGTFIRTSLNNNLRDTLYENRLNPITLLPGTGIIAYGQKTRAASTTAMDRVNVARLTNYLRVIFTGIANQYLFEPNDKITRDQVKSSVESILNDLVAKRGVYDYIVVCDETNNTSDRIARNELYVDVAIEPVRAVEFIYIPIRLKNPGTISGGAATAVTA